MTYMDLSTFSAAGRKIVCSQGVVAQLDVLRGTMLRSLRDEGWRSPTGIEQTNNVSSTQFRRTSGVLLTDPMFGNCQLQFELTLDWAAGASLRLASYLLAPGHHPRPNGEVGTEPLSSVALAQLPGDWLVLATQAGAEAILAGWLDELEAVPAEAWREFRAAFDAAMAP